jgi:glutamate 5-kinase
MLGRQGIVAGQILLTLHDTEERRRYLNARETLGRLLDMRAVPVINENDTVATARDPLRRQRPPRRPRRHHGLERRSAWCCSPTSTGSTPRRRRRTRMRGCCPSCRASPPEIEAMAGGAASELSRGGMQTKIEAGKIATTGGAIWSSPTAGQARSRLSALTRGAPCTWFLTPSNPVTARKKWIAGSLEPRGTRMSTPARSRAVFAMARACCRPASSASRANSLAATAC